MDIVENKYHKKSHQIYILMCCVFCGFYFVRDIIGIGVNWYIIYAVGAFTVLIVSKEEIIAFLVSIAAFSNAGFNGVFAMMILACVLLRFFYDLKVVKLYSFLPLIMIVFETLHYFMTQGIDRGVWLTYVCFILVLIIIQQYDTNKIDKVFVMKSFISFSLFFVLMTIIQMLKIYGSFENMINIGFRSEEYKELLGEYAHLIGNSNFLTSLSSLNLCVCAVLIPKVKQKWSIIAAVCIFLFAGLLTVSKLFIVVLVAFAGYVVFYAYKKNIKYGIGVSIVLLVAVGVIFNLFGDNLIQMVVDRLTESDWSTGRTGIVESLLAYMNAHPYTYVTGLGILQTSNYIGHAVHSSFFEVLGGWGVLGVLLAITYIVVQIREAKMKAEQRGSSPTPLNYLPILMFLGYSLAGMLFSSSLALIRMTVAFYAIEIGGKSEI